MYSASTSLLNTNLRSLLVRCRCHRRGYASSAAAASSRKLPFKIPEPIERSPTALLEALASTVKEDETAAPFNYIDDPVTMPTSTTQRRMYAMSKELGRRTARKLVEEWPSLFSFDRDKPYLKAFRPQKPLDPELVEANEENLQKMVADRQVTSAVKMYERIKAKPKDKNGEDEEAIIISDSTKLDLFRLLCYYNAEDVPLAEFEEWHILRNYYMHEDSQSRELNWKTNGLAEDLFDELPKTDELYSTLICGLCKFRTEYSSKRALELYKEMTDRNNMLPHEEVFNSMLMAQIPLRTNGTEQFDVSEWLREMGSLAVRPSVRTFNAALYALTMKSELELNPEEQKDLKELEQEAGSIVQADQQNDSEKAKSQPTQSDEAILQSENAERMQRWEQAKAVIGEMMRLGLEPSLTTYYMTMHLVTDEKMMENLLDEALGRLEQQTKLERVEETDSLFFLHGMRWAAEFLANERLVDRLAELYKSERNTVHFERQLDQENFFLNFLAFKLGVLSLDAFHVVYKAHVPHYVGLPRALLYPIMRTMSLRKPAEFCWPLLKRMTEDTISSSYISDDKAAYYLLRDFRDVKPRLLSKPDYEEYMALAERLVRVVEQLDQMLIEREEGLARAEELERKRRKSLAYGEQMKLQRNQQIDDD